MKKNKPKYNPIVGYVLLDKNYHVMCPHGESFDPVFHSKERALEAAKDFNITEAVFKVGEIYLEGTFNVILYDEGDLKLDGQTAKRLVLALKKRGMFPNKKASKQIDISVKENKYSCRELFGDIEYNRKIALGQIRNES